MAIQQQIVGTVENFSHVYSKIGLPHPRPSLAVRAGLRTLGHDDFNIGVLRGGRLVELWWMDEQIEEPPEVLAEIARQIGVPS